MRRWGRLHPPGRSRPDPDRSQRDGLLGAAVRLRDAVDAPINGAQVTLQDGLFENDVDRGGEDDGWELVPGGMLDTSTAWESLEVRRSSEVAIPYALPGSFLQIEFSETVGPFTIAD